MWWSHNGGSGGAAMKSYGGDAAESGCVSMEIIRFWLHDGDSAREWGAGDIYRGCTMRQWGTTAHGGIGGGMFIFMFSDFRVVFSFLVLCLSFHVSRVIRYVYS